MWQGLLTTKNYLRNSNSLKFIVNNWYFQKVYFPIPTLGSNFDNFRILASEVLTSDRKPITEVIFVENI